MLSPNDEAHLIARCDVLRAEAMDMRAELGRLARLASAASRPDTDAAAVAAALVRWIEAAKHNTATLRLIRRVAQEADGRRLARRALAPLRRELAQAGALLVRLRAEHQLRALRFPAVVSPVEELPSGRVLR